MLASYPGSSQLFNIVRKETRERGKTYHMSDVAGGTDLFNLSGTKSSQFHLLHHSRDRFYQPPSFSRAVLKTGKYKANAFS